MKGVEHPRLRVAVQVDEQVAARDQVEPRKGRVAQHIVHGKKHGLAQLAPCTVAAVLLDEEAAQPVFAHIGHDGRRVDAFARHADRVVIEVGGKHLQRRRGVEHARVLGEQHGHRIRLFARGAARHPHAHGVRPGLAFEQTRYVRLQRRKALAVAEKVGHADEQVLQQSAGLAGARAQAIQVARHIAHVVDLHAPADTAHDGGALVVAEITPGTAAHEAEHIAQRCLVGGRAGLLRPACRGGLGGQAQVTLHAVVLQHMGRHLGHRQRPVHHAGGNRRAGHAVDLGFLRVLCNGQATAFLDALDAHRAVAIGPRQHDGGSVRAMGVRQGAKEDVDCNVAVALFGQVTQLQVAVERAQRFPRWNDVHGVGLDLLGLLHLQHAHGGAALQHFGQHTVVLGREMHHDHKGQPRVGRHGREEPAQGIQPPSGATEPDHRQHLVAARGNEVVGVVGQLLLAVVRSHVIHGLPCCCSRFHWRHCGVDAIPCIGAPDLAASAGEAVSVHSRSRQSVCAAKRAPGPRRPVCPASSAERITACAIDTGAACAVCP